MSPLRKAWESLEIGAGNAVNWWMRRSAGSFNVLELTLAGPVVEEIHVSGLVQKLFPSPFLTMRDLLAGLSYAAEDENIKVLLIRVAGHDLGWGRAAELCVALQDFRAAGKYAIAYLEEPENIDTLIAASCDRVIVPPGIPVYLTGLLSEVMYFKGILDKLEIEPELFQAGKYKSAVEPFTRSGMSKPHREAVEAMLDSIYDYWVSALAAGRGLAREQVTDLIDEGPWLAEEAKERGLVDELLYEDELDDYMEKWLGLVPSRVPLERFRKLYAPRPRTGDPWRNFEALALITAAGTIHGGESRFYGGDSSVGADTLRHALRDVREDDNIVAAVLRVDSPGGSAVHSDLIWREVEKLREKKPVVVSMADVAASGGYYIAMPADHIVASPATLTGSIGVIGGKLNLKGLYEKVGIKKEHVTRGQHADLGTDYGPYSQEIRGKIKREMESVYQVFVEKAAKSRKLERKDLESAAQGRVWTGEQAKKLGLVDELGNLMTAIQRAKERAGIPAARRVPVLSLPRPRRFSLPSLPFPFPLPFGSRNSARFSRGASARGASALTRTTSLFSSRSASNFSRGAGELTRAGNILSQLELLADSPLLALLPYHLRIR